MAYGWQITTAPPDFDGRRHVIVRVWCGKHHKRTGFYSSDEPDAAERKGAEYARQILEQMETANATAA